ncbi:MAG: NAD(P)/FAD-dependent oxidoreductase [Bacillota bacterium]|nr:NAD(P)/FAD-dependent oxidoreductase [Bacillota bacterium]
MTAYEHNADVVVIGAGVVGNAIARELARYDVSVVLLEREADVAWGTTKANTALVHAGYDAEPGTNKARFNVTGNAMYPRICAELGVQFQNTGSLVVATSPDQVDHLRELLERGRANGVPGLEIIGRERIVELEPNISPEAIAALWAPTAGITGPWELAIAYAENAVENGVKLMLSSPVTAIDVEGGRAVRVHTPGASIAARFVVNAAGLFADEVARMVGQTDFEIVPRKGEYYLLDKRAGHLARRPLFPVPTAHSKGIVVTPTVDGNLLVGPNSYIVDSKADLDTTGCGLDEVLAGAGRLVPGIPVRDNITNFAGLRATASPGNDFVIGPAPGVPNFINAAGIQSPGLTAAPAIALEIVRLLGEAGLALAPKADFNPIRPRPARFAEMTDDERAEAAACDPRWGHIVCRCESVTEGEIVEALHRSVPCTTVDGVKFRTRAGSGRCQGGFCGPRVVAIISRELGIPADEVTKKGGASRILVGPSKQGNWQCEYGECGECSGPGASGARGRGEEAGAHA